MDISGLVHSYVFWTWVVGILLGYLLLLLGGGWVVKYFCGQDTAWEYSDIVGAPLHILFWIGNGIVSFFTAPWRYRTRRLFKESFGFQFHSVARDQREVNSKLTLLADIMQQAFNEQEAARKSKKVTYHGGYSIDVWAKLCKDNFWTAHHSAKKLGFSVQRRYKSYLTGQTYATVSYSR